MTSDAVLALGLVGGTLAAFIHTFDWYDDVPDGDILAHVGGGLFVGAALVVLPVPDDPYALVVGVLAVALAWELFEVWSPMPGLVKHGVVDTLSDVVAVVVGGAAIALL